MCNGLTVRKELRAMYLGVLHAGVLIGLRIGARCSRGECQSKETKTD